MTLKGVFFLLGQYIYGGNCYFVNGPTLSRGRFGTSCPEAAGSVLTPEHAAGMGQETFSGRTEAERKMEGTYER